MKKRIMMTEKDEINTRFGLYCIRQGPPSAIIGHVILFYVWLKYSRLAFAIRKALHRHKWIYQGEAIMNFGDPHEKRTQQFKCSCGKRKTI